MTFRVGRDPKEMLGKELAGYLDYCPETGLCTWNKAPSCRVRAGARAGGHQFAPNGRNLPEIKRSA